jgi:hypothetical protein
MSKVLDSHVLAVRDCLYDAENVEHVLNVLVQREHSAAALSTVAGHMLTDEVTLMWTEEGFAPFRHQPDLVVPYRLMTKRQLACVHDVLLHAVDLQLTQTCPKSVSGLSVYVSSLSHAAVKAEASHVLYAVVRELRRTPVLAAMSHETLCTRVLHGLHMSVVIAKQSFRDALHMLRAGEPGAEPGVELEAEPGDELEAELEAELQAELQAELDTQ